MRKYHRCKNCIMDTSDPYIKFNELGICNHCLTFNEVAKKNWFPNKKGSMILRKIVNQIKIKGKRNRYDCILGLSGGLDSSYLALKIYELGLKPLVIHVDAGWNTELAVKNIESIVKYCGFNLHTHVVYWEDIKNLHLAYLKSGVPNQDVPQDHIFTSSIYHFAAKNNIKYIISGGNLATEGIFPSSWLGNNLDARNLNFIYKKYSNKKLKSYKTLSMFDYYFWFPFIKGLRTVRPLNYMQYNKKEALKELKDKVDYKEYPRKHGESIFTKFFQNYYLPKRFAIDKRLPHLSSLIVSNQISRKDALKLLEENLYDAIELKRDKEYIAKKLGIKESDLDKLIQIPKKSFYDFPNNEKYIKKIKYLQRMFNKIFKKDFKIYS